KPDDAMVSKHLSFILSTLLPPITAISSNPKLIACSEEAWKNVNVDQLFEVLDNHPIFFKRPRDVLAEFATEKFLEWWLGEEIVRRLKTVNLRIEVLCHRITKT
ncbi:hypothetical protein R3P38DRAFT_2950301, partial [Favolaschia claudopus]